MPLKFIFYNFLDDSIQVQLSPPSWFTSFTETQKSMLTPPEQGLYLQTSMIISLTHKRTEGRARGGN